MSSESYVTDITGYSVTRGRFVQIDDLHASKIEPLSDGVALTLSQPGCRVPIRFDDENTKVMEPDRGVILVCGYAHDYILESELRSTAPARR